MTKDYEGLVMSLDKYWGTFGGIGGAALQESWNELRAAEVKSQRRAIQRQQKLEDDEFNSLLDHYEHEKALKKRALKFIDQLEEQYGELAEKYEELVEKHNSLATSLRQTQSELVKQKNTNQELLNSKLAVERENLDLKKALQKQ